MITTAQRVRRQRQADGRQAHHPGPPPERRMDQVDGVIEDVAEGRGLQRHARQLAVDGVEEGHDPGRSQAPAVVAVPERTTWPPARSTRLSEVTMLGVMPRLRAPAGDRARRARPAVQRHEIGDALVGAREDARLDVAQVLRGQRQQEGRFALAQRVVVAAGQLRRRAAAADPRAPRRSAAASRASATARRRHEHGDAVAVCCPPHAGRRPAAPGRAPALRRTPSPRAAAARVRRRCAAPWRRRACSWRRSRSAEGRLQIREAGCRRRSRPAMVGRGWQLRLVA